MGVEGLYEFTTTFNENLLEKTYRALSDDARETLSIDKLRYLFRGLLLDMTSVESEYGLFHQGEYLLGSYELVCNLVAQSKPGMLVQLVQKLDFKKNRMIPSLQSVTRKKVCQIRIELDDSWIVDGKATTAEDLGLPSEMYDYLVCGCNQRNAIQIKYISSSLKVQKQELMINGLEKRLREVENLYETKIARIKDLAINLINSKKQKIRDLTYTIQEAGIEIPETQPLKLHENVEIKQEEIEDNESRSTDDEREIETPRKGRKRKRPKETARKVKKVKPFKDDSINRTRETFRNESASNSDFDVELSSGPELSDEEDRPVSIRSSPSKSPKIKFQKRYTTDKADLGRVSYEEDFKYGLRRGSLLIPSSKNNSPLRSPSKASQISPLKANQKSPVKVNLIPKLKALLKPLVEPPMKSPSNESEVEHSTMHDSEDETDVSSDAQ